MSFRLEIDYTREDIRRFNRANKRLRYRVLYIVLYVLVLLTLAAVLAAFVLAAGWRVWNAELTRYAVILLMMTALWVYLNLSRNTVALRSLNAMGTTTVTTTEQGLHAAARGMSTDLAYSAICDIVHCRDTYFLYVNKRRATILPERCFTEGDPAAFGAFLAEKTGLKLKEIK